MRCGRAAPFLYVPKGVHIDMPLQTYFRMNARASGQFEHTLIIVDEGASVQYIEGCTAPLYHNNSLHAAVVEIFVKKGARSRYTTIQNWSKDVYNLNTKRAIVEEDAIQEWVGGSLGSKVTMLYPCSILKGRGARADHLNIAVAGPRPAQGHGSEGHALSLRTRHPTSSPRASASAAVFPPTAAS